MISVPVFVECAYCCSELGCAVIIKWTIEGSARRVVHDQGAVMERVSVWGKKYYMKCRQKCLKVKGWIRYWGCSEEVSIVAGALLWVVITGGEEW